MTRFGDFTLHKELAESEVADCFEATHDVQGGPFFLKRYRRIDPAYTPALLYRCEVLMAVQHPNLAPHLGHGDVDGVVFAVSPYLEGIDLDGFIASVKQRRVVVKLEALLYIVREVARGVAALHAVAVGGHRALLAHGDVCTRHVRLGPAGEVWLTGLPTPRGLAPDRPPEVIWDAAGLGALLYDLIPLTRTGGQRPPLPGPLDRVVRRTLGIGPVADQMPPAEFAERLDEVAELLKLPRLEPRLLADAAARAIQHHQGGRGLNAADALPTLEPVLPAVPLVPAEPAPPPPRPSPAPAPAPAPTAAPSAATASAPAPAVDPFRETAPIERPAPLLADNQVPTEPPDASPFDFSSGPDEAPVMPPPVRAAPPARAERVPASPPPAPRAPTPSPFDLVDDLPLDPDGELPLDPFVEHTLPSHLLGLSSLPADEPSAFEVNPTPLSTPKPPSSEGFEHARTRPEVSAHQTPTPSPPSVSPPPLPRAPSLTDPDGPLAPALEIPREISAIMKLDAPLRERLGLLADPPEAPADSASALTSPTSDDAFAPSSSARTDAPTSALESVTEGPAEPPLGSAPETHEEEDEDPAIAALLSRGVVTQADVRAAREAQRSRGGKVPEILVAMGLVTDATLADTLAAAADKPRLADQGLFASLPEPELCRRLPQTYALARRMLPLVLEDGQLTLAVADPFDDVGIREVARLVSARSVRVQVASRSALTDATLKAYRALGARLASGEGSPSVLLCMTDEDETARFGARLADEGFHVAHAADVPTAKMLLDAHPPAALILALDVPEAESLLVFSRGHEDHADTPVFVTGEAGDDAAMAHILDLGADDFFERPASLNVVMAKLRRAVNKRGPTTSRTRPGGPPPLPASITRPPEPEPEPRARPSSAPKEPTPPPTFDFWENSAPLDEMAPYEADAPGDTRDSGPMYAEPTGVMGTLRQMAVTEIVQSLELGRKTARVELVPTDGQRGMVGFEDGRIVYAECGNLRGEKAFYALARHTEGFFRIRYGEGPTQRNVDNTTTYLLLEAMRLMDEESNPSEHVEDLGAEKTPTPFD